MNGRDNEMDATVPTASSQDRGHIEQRPTPRLALLPAFAGYGIEIEYMIVNRATLDVQPIADQLLTDPEGSPTNDVEHGNIGWSNELALHVLELKNIRPVPDMTTLVGAFQDEVRTINDRLEALDACLMPGGVHPWMDPRRETQLWPHDHAEIYRSFDRIFDCRRHGWSNLQSVHLNLPFADDAEFARLHAAVRLVLPILPALAASSPWVDGKATGFMDYRVEAYRKHQARIPTSMGKGIPEPSRSPTEYREHILVPMLNEITSFDDVLGPDAGALSQEWVDARAAVPRFARHAIEVRLLDVQESTTSNLAVAAATAALVRRLYDDMTDAQLENPLPTDSLVTLLERCTRDAEHAIIDDELYLSRLGLGGKPCAASKLWSTLIDAFLADGLLDRTWLPALTVIRAHGPLARRLSEALDGDPGRLRPVYARLCECLRDDAMFLATG
ncbi:carboxylate-amine ligase [Propionivibrio soli]|uniref:carboxylate-amine ligase n=1 Tax=Propionivibrio soli TaxID=2976531 RepID=UPI0021E9389F|nr:glutamate-cysteine ligase family protein [Propionivibrio soli]